MTDLSQLEQKIHVHMQKGECPMEIASHFFISVLKAEKYILKIEKKLKLITNTGCSIA